jgi:uncharacterized protein (TIGR00730 family)
MSDNTIFSKDPWRMFRIISEFVDGFETMTKLGPCVSFFGSSTHLDKDSHYYKLAEEIAKKVSQKGFSVITGGGSGIMEAANKGAQEANGKSCGLCINLPKERPNKYIDSESLLSFRYFFVRKVMFIKYAKGFIVLPGGFGTLDELFEAITLINTNKIKRFPIFLVGKHYWSGLLDWLKNVALSNKYIDKEALDDLIITDDPDEIAETIKRLFDKEKSIENF